jgi:AcrR family transcriptional regulator
MQKAPKPAARERQQRMRDAAIELLYEMGYAVSMDAVAQRAGFSKQTVYKHFGSKEGLFRSVVADIVAPIGDRLDHPDGDFADSLRAFALAHQEHLAEPRTVAAIRMFSVDVARYPDDARALFAAGVESMQRRLAVRIAAAMDRGELRRDDPAEVAELLLGMLVGFESDRRRLGVPGRDTQQERAAWVDRAVTMFLRAYGNDAGGRAPENAERNTTTKPAVQGSHHETPAS